MIELNWPQFIAAVKQFRMSTRYIDTPVGYVLRAWDEVFSIGSTLKKGDKNSIAFETGYKDAFNTMRIQKSRSFAAAQNSALIHAPLPAKRYVIRSFNASIRNTTLADQTLQIFDETNTGNNIILEESLAVGSEKYIRDYDVFISAAIGNRLRITFTGDMAVGVRFRIHETF